MGVLVTQIRAQNMLPPHYGPPYAPINTSLLHLPQNIPPPDSLNPALHARLDDLYASIEIAREKANRRVDRYESFSIKKKRKKKKIGLDGIRTHDLDSAAYSRGRGFESHLGNFFFLPPPLSLLLLSCFSLTSPAFLLINYCRDKESTERSHSRSKSRSPERGQRSSSPSPGKTRGERRKEEERGTKGGERIDKKSATEEDLDGEALDDTVMQELEQK